MSDGRRGVTDLAAPVLHARKQAEVAEERDRAIDGSLADAVATQGVGRLADGRGAVRAGEELPDQPALAREGDALLTEDRLDVVGRQWIGQGLGSAGSS